MKTLVVQLARFGDIYQSWPTLWALSERPSAEVHLLVRERFKAATIGLPEAVHVHVMPTADLLKEAYETDRFESYGSALENFLKELEAQQFTEVINLSYSSFSSYLTSYLEMKGARVSGYTRHEDGFLNLKDDASAYFYAQVGVERPNRIHVTQLFSMTAGVELEDRHLHPKPPPTECGQELPENYFVLHIGASDFGKVLKPSQWNDFVRSFLSVREESLVLIGVSSEKEMAQSAKPRLGSERIVDLVGKTEIDELFPILAKAKGFIGCDSSPLQAASLMNVPILNLRNSHVNTFETGPFSERFVIWDFEKEPRFARRDLQNKFDELFGQELSPKIPEPGSVALQQWMLLKALYLGGPYPHRVFRRTLVNLVECLEKLPGLFEAYGNSQQKENQRIISQFDQWLAGAEDPLFSVVIRWFNGERIRIPPGKIHEVQEKSREVLNKLYLILSDWLRVLEQEVTFLSPIQNPKEHLAETAKQFRFLNLNSALKDLEQFLVIFSDEFSTEVGARKMDGIKKNLERALSASDFERVADLLEYELSPLIEEKDVMWSGENSSDLC